jgi:hypothetical protein
VAVTTGGAMDDGERRAHAWRPPGPARAAWWRAGVVLLGLAAAGCGGAATEHTETAASAALEPSGALVADPLCDQGNPAVARAHLAAAGRVRGTLAMGEAGQRWELALAHLESTQRACLEVASTVATSPTAPAWGLRAALLADTAVPRADRGGVPSLSWRLLEDAAARASRAIPDVDQALADGRLADAATSLLAAQRARLLDLPEVLRFLDEAGRAALLSDPAWIRWLGVSS